MVPGVQTETEEPDSSFEGVPNTIPIDHDTFRWLAKTVSNINLMTGNGFDRVLIDYSAVLRHSLMNFGVRRLAGGLDNASLTDMPPVKETIVTESFSIVFMKLRSEEWQDSDFVQENEALTFKINAPLLSNNNHEYGEMEVSFP
jgi:hypothetical protein